VEDEKFTNETDGEESFLIICLDRIEHGINLLIHEKEKEAIAHFSCLYGRMKSFKEHLDKNDPT